MWYPVVAGTVQSTTAPVKSKVEIQEVAHALGPATVSASGEVPANSRDFQVISASGTVRSNAVVGRLDTFIP